MRLPKQLVLWIFVGIVLFETGLWAFHHFYNQQTGQVPSEPFDSFSGYIDKDGHGVLTPPLPIFAEFHEGLAISRGSLSRATYIDKQGRVVIKSDGAGSSILNARPFSNGLAAVSPMPKNDPHIISGPLYSTWGYIDTSGHYVITPRFYEAGEFTEGLAPVVVKIDQYRNAMESVFIDTKGKAILTGFSAGRPFYNGLAVVSVGAEPHPTGALGHDGQFGVIDKTGRFVVPPKFAELSDFSEGLAAARVVSGGKVGYIDAHGNWVIAPQFNYARDFREGLAPVMPWSVHEWGFIDKKGRMVIPARFDDAEPFSDGRALITEGHESSLSDGPPMRCYFIDRAGKRINAKCFRNATSYSEGLAAVNWESLLSLPQNGD